jgi:hypothetical protein
MQVCFVFEALQSLAAFFSEHLGLFLNQTFCPKLSGLALAQVHYLAKANKLSFLYRLCRRRVDRLPNATAFVESFNPKMRVSRAVEIRVKNHSRGDID